MKVERATLHDGRIVEFVPSDDPPAGGMKKTFFSPDRSYVVQFFHDQNAGSDPQRLARLEAILGKYNPTVPETAGGARGANQVSADYFKSLFCWPTGIVTKPQFGIVAPVYPGNFFFGSGPFKGKEKNGKWFSSPKLRKLLPEGERGTWINYFKLGILMARAVTRLHMAGLAHSDLSSNNVLVDPVSGRVVVIDIDSLVVPGLFPPDVLGTPGYIAPEVLGTQHLPLTDKSRKHPSAATDQHALAVLLYEYLLFRHPLRGPKVNCTSSAEEDERLSMGEKAIYVEHPSDRSNRPSNLSIECSALGPILCSLFERAFVKGLHNPNDRPAAIEWERALVKTWDLLHPCRNSKCPSQWFILSDAANPKCPFCGTKAKGTIPVVKLRKEVRAGHWMQDGQLVLYNNSTMFKWHVFDNVYPGVEADRTPQGYCVWHGDKWLLVNQNMSSLTSPGGNRVPPGQAVELKEGAQIRLAQEPHGRIAEVQVVRV
jgi:hypothetical protein